MTKTRVSRSAGVIDKILEQLEDGSTLTRICDSDDMPSIRGVQKWCRADEELDEQILRAWIRGLRIRHDRNSDRQTSILENPGEYDPKIVNAMATVMRDINHNIMSMLSRLDKRFADRQTTVHEGNTPVVIGWMDSPTAIDAEPADRLPAPADPANGREYLNLPMRSPLSGGDDAPDDLEQADG